MSRNLEKDAVEMAAKNQRILEKGFVLFAGRGIDNVTMSDVAKAAGIGIASLYRYYSTKLELVLAIGTWAWKNYLAEQLEGINSDEQTMKNAAENVDYFLEAFLDLYRNHKDLLRFNQFFNVYMQSEHVPEEKIHLYNAVIHSLEERFARVYRQGQEDGTLRNDLTEEEAFSTIIHLMLATVTRYAVGLVYLNRHTDAEKELKIQKELLFRWFCLTEDIRFEGGRT